MAQDGKVLGGVVLSDSTLILSENDIQHPVQGVFNSLVGAHGFGEPLGIGREAGDVVPGFRS